MVYDPESSIPRICVTREKGKIFCYLDEKSKQRYGQVLLITDEKTGRPLSVNKQGRHLFSISYCIFSMALKYHDRNENEIINDILSKFHCDFLTMLIINSKFSGTATHFLKDWEIYFDQLADEYDDLSYQNPMDIDVLGNYLNLVGAMLHTLPCNVAFAEDASDSEGGARAKEAIRNINNIAEGVYPPKAVNQNIALTLDFELIEELFTKGFDDNNIYVLAFMIMQIIELQSLQNKRRSGHSYVGLNKEEIESHVFDIAFKSNGKILRDDSFSEAITKAANLIDSTKNEVRLKLNGRNYQGIKNSILQGVYKVYSLID